MKYKLKDSGEIEAFQYDGSKEVGALPPWVMNKTPVFVPNGLQLIDTGFGSRYIWVKPFDFIIKHSSGMIESMNSVEFESKYATIDDSEMTT